MSRIDFDALKQAIGDTLQALGQHQANLVHEPENAHKHTEGLRKAIASYPAQFAGTDWRGDAAVPFNAVVQLLATINAMHHELRYLAQYEGLHYEHLERWTQACLAFADPRETDRHKYNQAALNALGLNQRPRDKYAKIAAAFKALRSEGRGVTESYRTLAERHSLSPDTIRKGIKRHLAG